jgi:hypothetical protein
MEDGEEVILIILRRGLKNPKLRAALLSSHLVNLHQWLIGHPDLMEAYYAPEQPALIVQKSHPQRRRRP